MTTDAQKYPDMPDGASRALQDALQSAYDRGRDAGRAAGSWAADGNTTVDHARAVLDMIADGDPAAYDYFPVYPNLLGEWSDAQTPASLAREILDGIDHAPADLDIGSTDGYPPPSVVDMIADAWEHGVSDTFLDACTRELQAVLPDPADDAPFTVVGAIVVDAPIITTDMRLEIARIERDYRQPVVAIIFGDDGSVDHAFNWETAQSMALSDGARVVALKDDGHMSAAAIQSLCDAERDRYRDCFGA